MKFHLTESEDEGKVDEAAVGVGGAVSEEVGIGIPGLRAVPVEDVGDVEGDGEAFLPEVGIESHIDRVGALFFDKQRLRGRGVVAREVQTDTLGDVCPAVETETIGGHRATVVSCLGVVHLVARAVEVGIEAEVEPGCGAVGDVAFDAGLETAAHVVWHAVGDEPPKVWVYLADCLAAIVDIVSGETGVTLDAHRAM